MNSVFSWRRMSAILVKEFIQLVRDRSTFAMIIMIPLIQLSLFGYAIDTNPKFLSATLLARDHSPFTRSFIAGLKNSEYFVIENETNSEQIARRLLQQGKTQFVVTIPDNYSRDLIRKDRPKILVEADASDPVATVNALSALDGILQSSLAHNLKGELAFLKGNPQPGEIRVHRLYNPEGFSRYNIVPGLMGMVLTMTGVMMTAMALTRERERGTMENLLAMPVQPLEVMCGKIAPYVLIGYLQSLIIIVTSVVLFGIPIEGSVLLLFSVLVVFIICNLALGFTMSTWAKNQMQAMQLSIMYFLPSMLLSGFMFPFQGMPGWAQFIGNIIPLTYVIRIVRGIMLKGNTFVEIWPHVWPLLLFMVVITTIAMKLYRRTLD